MSDLHDEDFVEMLVRGDSWDFISRSYGIKIDSLKRRFFRMPKDVRDKVRRHRELMGWELYT